MFMGTYYNSIDAKNRIIVPAKLRNQLGERCVLTIGLTNCLNIYSFDDWKKQMEKYESVHEADLETWDYIRDRFSNAEICEFDGQGRIIVPERLRDRVGLKKELVTMGVMSKIEIWSKEIWESPKESSRYTQEQRLEALKKQDF